jgi:hypothetical protein
MHAMAVRLSLLISEARVAHEKSDTRSGLRLHTIKKHSYSIAMYRNTKGPPS